MSKKKKEKSEEPKWTPEEYSALGVAQIISPIVRGYELTYSAIVLPAKWVAEALECGHWEDTRIYMEEFRTLVESPMCPAGGVLLFHAINRHLEQEEHWKKGETT